MLAFVRLRALGGDRGGSSLFLLPLRYEWTDPRHTPLASQPDSVPVIEEGDVLLTEVVLRGRR